MCRAVCSVVFAAAVAASAPAAAITTRNGAPHFLDSFADGAAPPSAPNFANATLASYYVAGFYAPGSETGGHLVVSSLAGALTGTADGQPSRNQRATLLTNSDPLNTVNGLKPNHTFTVSSLADIALASGPGSYGVRFTDRTVNLNGTSTVSQIVSVDLIPTSNIVRLRTQDFITDQALNVSSIAIPVGADQVRLALSHPVAGAPQVYATAEFFDNGESMGIFNVGGPVNIFAHNQFVRAEFSASELLPVPEPETYAMMLVGVGLVGWQLRRKAKAARAQYLA